MDCHSKKNTKLCEITEEAIELNNSDLISRLPEPIIQQILTQLPVEDAVPLSSVSKTWLNAWNNLPVFEYSFDAEEDVSLKKFVKRVDDSLLYPRIHRAIIESFSLKMNIAQEEGLNLDMAFHLYDWVSVIMRNYVKEISIRVFNNLNPDAYLLPESVFASRFLVKLHLQGCKFPSFDDKKQSFRFNSLKEISLVNVVASQDQVQKFINLSRPFLEKLTLKMCPSVQVLILADFLRLRYVEVHVRDFQVHEAPNLHILVVYGLWQVSAYGCDNIRTLRCLTWDFSAFRSIQALISKLPLLETLQLFMLRNQKIKIQSRQLRTLLLFEGQRFEDPMVVKLDTPELRTLYFSGLSIPLVTMINNVNPNQKIQFHHFGHPSGGLDGSHLHQIGKFLQNFIHPTVEIYLHQILAENMLSLEDLKENDPVVYHATNVRMLVLECIPASNDYTSFLNALFWSCHPNALVLLMTSEETLYSDHRNTFIEFLYYELIVDREENARCSRENYPCKCWRHYIADVKFYAYRSMHEFEKPIDLPHQLLQNGISIIDTKEKGVVVEFKFQWIPYPVSPVSN